MERQGKGKCERAMHAARAKQFFPCQAFLRRTQLNEELSVFSYDCFVIPVTYVSFPHADLIGTIAVGQVPTL